MSDALRPAFALVAAVLLLAGCAVHRPAEVGSGVWVPPSFIEEAGYSGEPLVSGKRVWWKVRVWDGHDQASPYSEPAWWEMGLLEPEDWSGDWITAPRLLPERAEDFYLKAAKVADDAEIKKFFGKLADMEKQHYEIFAQMRSQLGGGESETEVFDPDNEAFYYLKAMADSRGSEGMAEAGVEFTGAETMGEVFDTAIKAEKESINFYVGIKELVSAQAGKDKIDQIIKEEISHAAELSKRRAELK